MSTRDALTILLFIFINFWVFKFFLHITLRVKFCYLKLDYISLQDPQISNHQIRKFTKKTKINQRNGIHFLSNLNFSMRDSNFLNFKMLQLEKYII